MHLRFKKKFTKKHGLSHGITSHFTRLIFLSFCLFLLPFSKLFVISVVYYASYSLVFNSIHFISFHIKSLFIPFHCIHYSKRDKHIRTHKKTKHPLEFTQTHPTTTIANVLYHTKQRTLTNSNKNKKVDISIKIQIEYYSLLLQLFKMSYFHNDYLYLRQH